MLTKKQLNIFGLFGKNIFKELTFKELKTLSKEKSNSLIQNAIKEFLKEDLITQRNIGNNKLYKIIHNSKTHNYLELYNQEILPKNVIKSINIIKQAIDKKELFYSLVIFGSYADKTNKKDSDLDIAIFTNNKKLKPQLNSASNKTPLEIDYHIITEDEFSKMLKADYENLAKQIISKNIPIYNTSTFYKMIIKNTSNGFKNLY